MNKLRTMVPATLVALAPLILASCGSDSTGPSGATWTMVPSGTTLPLDGVGGTSPSDVWAVGDGGTIIHFNGSGWAASASGTANTLYAVWAASSADAWAVGANSTLLHYNGTSWSSATWPGPAALAVDGVWGSGPSDVWAVGS